MIKEYEILLVREEPIQAKVFIYVIASPIISTTFSGESFFFAIILHYVLLKE